MLFAQFGDSVARLTSLLSVHLDHPVNAMTAVCKRLALPKKAALEAISMFEMAVGNDDPYSLIMIRRFGRDPSGSHSVAGCGKCQ